MKIDLDKLDLSTRTYNCLIRHGVYTIGQLKQMSDEELHKVRNLNQKCINEIKQKLGGQ